MKYSGRWIRDTLNDAGFFHKIMIKPVKMKIIKISFRQN